MRSLVAAVLEHQDRERHSLSIQEIIDDEVQREPRGRNHRRFPSKPERKGEEHELGLEHYAWSQPR